MVSPPTTTPPLRKAGSWRAMQIIIYLAAVAFSIGTLVGYKGLNSLFNQDMHMCILYAKPEVKSKDASTDCEVPPNKTNNDHTCSFVYFSVIASVVYAIIGCWFFIACTSDAKTRPDETVIQSWKLVVPAIFFTIILTLLSVVSSSLLSGGVAEFTKAFSQESSANECQQFKTLRPENATLFMNEVHLYRTVAELFTWLSTAVWLLAVIVLTCRCCLAADFITSNSEPQPGSMTSAESSRTATMASQRSWKNSLRRFVAPLNSTISITRNLKGSLKGWRSETSINRNLLAKPLKKANASSPNMRGLPSSVLTPTVLYDHITSTVSLSDCDAKGFETPREESENESVRDTSYESAHSGALLLSLVGTPFSLEHATELQDVEPRSISHSS